MLQAKAISVVVQTFLWAQKQICIRSLQRSPALISFSNRKSVGSQTWDNHLSQEAVTIINTFCVLQNESCFSKGNRDLVTMNRQWWFSNYIFSRTLDNLHWTIRMICTDLMEIYRGICFHTTRSESITQNQKYKRDWWAAKFPSTQA